MQPRILIFILFFNVFFVSYSQFSVSISSNKSKSCADSSIQFIAKTMDKNEEVKEVNYIWSFGDGSEAQSGIDLDTIIHKFKKGRGYIVKVIAEKADKKDYAFKQIEIGLTPNFEGTKSDREKPICLGQQIFFTGKVQNTTWTYKPKYENIESKPVVLSNKQAYLASFDFRMFKKNKKIKTGDEIDTVGVKIEHKNLREVKIELISPEGKSLLLKDFGGVAGKSFGIANAENPKEVGTAYYYFWTKNSGKGNINSSSPTSNYLPKGAYKPDEKFSKLIGSALNGVWKIKITSKSTSNQGFIVASMLVIKGEKRFTSWTYSNKYTNHGRNRPEWLGAEISTTSDVGLATAVPVAYGNNRYRFQVTDDFNCKHDTALIANVEAASFSTTPDSAAGPFDLNVKFENTTSWVEISEWNFGDRSPESNEKSPEHVYTKHGKYFALLTAKTEDGCSDTMSIVVKVTIPPSSLDDVPNSFTPNGDGINDVFKLKKGSAIESLSCHIYSRWGKRVAVWNSIEDATEKGWDGKVPSGGKASAGVYYYVIKAVGFDGKVYDKKGSFHLFR